jgi:hypothetical protein
LKISIKENGKMEKNTDKDMKYGQMGQDLKECMRMIKNLDLEYYI